MLRNIGRSIKPTLKSYAARRAFHISCIRNDVTVFGMPAMSPTMEEGGIVSWKVKEGDTFSSGDVLLEVETDKATIDVEAQDDGIMAKILKHDGDKEIKVGVPIAFLAEPTDNLSELKYPEIEESTPKAPASAPKPETKAPALEKTEETSSKTASPQGSSANPDLVFLPSVEILLGAKGISREDALKNIKATGPKGRILIGDVKAYLGEIDGSFNTRIASYLDSKSHLDLSNIELRTAAAPAPADKAGKDSAKPAKKEPVTVSHQFVLSSAVPAEIISKLVSKASEKAEQFAYESKLYAPSDLIDPLFEDLIAPPRNADRFTVSTAISTTKSEPESVDEFDFEPYETKSAAELLTTVDVVLTLNEKVFDSKARADKFLQHFGEYLSHAEKKYSA